MSTAALIIVAVGLWAGFNGQAFRTWVREDGFYVSVDKELGKYGLALRDATRPGATIAVTAAGAVPYFSHRPGVDLLGKSDSHVANSDPHPVSFLPGHTKWDYRYSILELNPDVVAQLYFFAPPLNVVTQIRCEYTYVSGMLWYRTDSERVRSRSLEMIKSRWSVSSAATWLLPANDTLACDIDNGAHTK
jgi:hypothetical protein